MERISLLLLLTLILSSCHTNTKAQVEPVCVAKAPSEVGVNQQFQYVVSTNAKATILETDFGKFELVGGPSTSTSTSISMANGTTEQKTEYSYVYFLSINREGTYTIPGVSVSVDGKVMHTDPVVVKVVKSPKMATENNDDDRRGFFEFQWPDFDSFFGGGGDGKDNKNDRVEYKDDISKDDMFVKAFVSQTEAYKGEPVVVTHKLYIKKEIRDFEIARANFASTDAAWIDPMELNYRDETTETVKGETYHVYTIKQTAVYPTKVGKVVVPKLDLVMRIAVPAVVNSPFWGRMNTMRAKDFQLSANELSLKVKPLPNSRNDDKTDIVGHFDISAQTNKSEVNAGRPVTITITVSGNGNLHHIEKDDIDVDFPAAWDQMYPKVYQNISAKGNLVSGSKTFRYTFVPHDAGEYYIPAAKLTYYDDESMTYKTISTQDLRIIVMDSDSPSNNSEEKKSKVNGKTYKI